MIRCASRFLAIGLVVLGSAGMVASAAAVMPVELSQVDWTTIGSQVRFHLQFHNPDPVDPSGEVSGEIQSQHFGAFLPNYGPIGTFDIPALVPDSFFDITYDIDLSSLPPGAEKILPGGGPSGPVVGESPQVACPLDTFWAGNVDIIWAGPGGAGQANVHMGTILICPGAGNSYIHVIMDCQDPAGITWSITGLCPGWSATLVSSGGGGLPGDPAPNPIPMGPFDGWICVSAAGSVITGQTCQFNLNVSCGSQPAVCQMTAEACDWAATPVVPSTWGRVKGLYRE